MSADLTKVQHGLFIDAFSEFLNTSNSTHPSINFVAATEWLKTIPKVVWGSYTAEGLAFTCYTELYKAALLQIVYANWKKDGTVVDEDEKNENEKKS